DRSSAVLLADEQRCPAELGTLTPVLLREPGGIVAQPPQLADGHLLVEEALRRLAEERLVFGGLQQQVSSSLALPGAAPQTHRRPASWRSLGRPAVLASLAH